MRLPKKIEKCPIVETVVEIRFTSNVYADAIFGLVYNTLKGSFNKVEKLPILQLPEQIREHDPGLKYKPHYKLSNGQYSLQVGPEVLTISSPVPYPGWNNYQEVINDVLTKILEIELVSQVSRLGMRYINFFEFDIFQKINLDVQINGKNINYKNTSIRTEVEALEFINGLQISNHAENITKSNVQKGSIIDIDTFKIYDNNQFITNFQQELENGRNSRNQTFFSLLDQSFLTELNPIY